MNREELIKDKNFIVSGIQLQLLNLIEGYMKKNKLNRDKLAKELKVSKGYVSQLLNVSYDHKISKLVDLALSCNAMPLFYFVDLDKYIKDDASDKVYELMPVVRLRNMTYLPSSSLKENKPPAPPKYTVIRKVKLSSTGDPNKAEPVG